jgi:hypothetical protein
VTDEFDDLEGARLQQLGEQQDSFEREHEDDPSSFQIGYVRGVKLITGKKRWDLALRRVQEFLDSQGFSKKERQQFLSQHRQKGFTGAKIIRLQKEGAAWWKKEKSRKARKSRKERGKKKRTKKIRKKAI